ncbi:Rieske (2Fe-2S) protein [Halobacterium yunchengense]|uniref:Rieske (2Fe-2S) protein n=1 Tax=Halobacterium yunchengense TaxID=3108497 RepID=UPI0030085878
MRDAVRVSVEAGDDQTAVRVHDDAGEVSAGDATFRFSVGGTDREDATGDAPPEPDDRSDPRHVAPLSDVPTDSTLRCEALHGRRGTEVILQRDGDDVLAWRNACPHRPNVRLDPGDGAIVDDDQLVCHEHGARFECEDGVCTRGPCAGDALDAVAVAARDGAVYLADDRFDACRRLD